MSDETPQADGEPTEASPQPENTPVAEGPTEAVQPAQAPVEAPTAAAPEPVTVEQPRRADEDDVVPAPVPPRAAAAAPNDRPGIFVPKWVGMLAAAVVAALVFGGIGYAIGQSNDSSNSQAASSNRPTLPNGNGNRQFPNFGGGNSSGNSGNSNGNGSSGESNGNSSNGNSSNGNGSNGFPNFGGGSANGGSTTTGNGGFLGVGIENASTGNGAQVTTVQTGSAAATAGLKNGDVITAVDGQSVASASDLAGIVQQHSSGDTITITYTRNGTSATAKVTLGTRPTTGTPS